MKEEGRRITGWGGKGNPRAESRSRIEGSCRVASMHTQQGEKGANQDAMVLLKNFAGEKGTVFCGVFDGHGPHGHRVARFVRDILPEKLCESYYSVDQRQGNEILVAEEEEDDSSCGFTHPRFNSWKADFLKAFQTVDDHLRWGADFDCTCSGATAVSVVKQNDHLMIANLGDSRAVLATRDDSNQLVPVQLTVDLKPNVESEASRIKKYRGRVFALEEEPEVPRVWLPDQNLPGLAMARAFGDFCLKDYGVISTPKVTYRKLTERDEFVVLSTDGVWDVLTNEEVVEIVSSARRRSEAAKKLIKRAVEEWEIKHPKSRIDDCAVIILFLKRRSGDRLMSLEKSKGAGQREERIRVSRFGGLLKSCRRVEVGKYEEAVDNLKT